MHLIIAVATTLLVWVAAWLDFRTFRIANALPLSGVLLGALLNVFDGGLTGLVLSLYGIALGLVLFMPFHYIGRMGAGDVKLLAAIGALLGPWWLLKALVPILISAGTMALLYAFWAHRARGAPGPGSRYARMLRYLWTLGRLDYLPPAPGEAMAERLPLAVPIALGTTLTVVWWIWSLVPRS